MVTTNKKVRGIATSPDNKNDINDDVIITEKDSQSLTNDELDTTETVISRNRFNSLGEAQAFIIDKFVNGSGVDPMLFDGCSEFHSDVEWTDGMDVETPIHNALNWKPRKRFTHQVQETQYAALLLNEDGSTWQAMVTDWDEERQRPYKYWAPTGNGDRAFKPHIPNNIRKKIGGRYGVEVPTVKEYPLFWEWLKTCNKIPKILTEGAGKALSLLSQGYVAIALYGCSCGGRVNKYGLIDDLKQLNQEESIWLFGLDRDEAHKTKLRVNSAKKQLKLTLENDGVKFYVEDIFWRSEDGKGVDDLIVNKGSGAFDTAYQSAIAKLEKQVKNGGYSSEDDKDYKPRELKVAQEIAEKYRDILAFNDEVSAWMRYASERQGVRHRLEKEGVWYQETNEFIESVVYRLLISEGYTNFKSAFVSNVTKMLRHELILKYWEEKPPNVMLPFANGVYSIKERKLLEHSHTYRLRWQLPRSYEPDGTWDNINQYLDHLSAHSPKMKDILLCFCNAVLKGRSDLQKCLYLIGLPKTGKGTFLRLLTKMIGIENIHATKLEVFCTDKFDVGNVRGKRLVLFSDQQPYSGSVSEFLSLTGEDNLRGEKKNKDAKPFSFDGMSIIAANHAVFSGSNLNAVNRRLISFPCQNLVTKEMRKDLDSLFEPEIGAFTAYVLNIPDSHVTAVLGNDDEVQECNIESWENRCRTDGLAAWANDCLIADPLAMTVIGRDKNEWRSGSPCTLFGSYAKHAEETGRSGQCGANRFSDDLLDLLKLQMKWESKYKRTNTGRFLTGIRLRVPGQDDHIPPHDVWLEKSRVTVGDNLSDNLSDNLNTLPDKESVNSDNLNDTLTDRTEDAFEYVEPSPTITLDFQVGDFVTVVRHANKPELVGSIQVVKFVNITSIVFDSGEFVYHSADIEKLSPPDNTELLRTCIHDQSWEMITELTEQWPQEFKKAVWALLTQAERDAINNMKPATEETERVSNPKVEIISGCPHLQVGGIYYGTKNGQGKFKIKTIRTTKDEVIGILPGVPLQEITIAMIDIVALKESPLTTLQVGDEVVVFTGKKKGQKGVIERIDICCWVRFPKSTVALSFYSHHLRKVD